MCGIAGYCGHSKNPKLSYLIMTELFKQTETRGRDASGFWFSCADTKETETGEIIPGKIGWDRAPIKSSEYVKTREIWKKVENLNPILLIAHCRQPTKMGDEKVNENNHPHTSDDANIAVVHNGKIPEFNSLKSEYVTSSGCDSEILLRMFEHSEENVKFAFQEEGKEDNTDKHILYRLSGIRDIYAKVNFGAMAVAIAEYRPNGLRDLWLFRDDDRPLHIIDLRDTLGQIFFCSTDEIWEKTINALPDDVKKMLPDTILVSPPYYVWTFTVDSFNKDYIGYCKFGVNKSKNTIHSSGKPDKKDRIVKSAITEILREVIPPPSPPEVKGKVGNISSKELIVSEKDINAQDNIEMANIEDEDIPPSCDLTKADYLEKINLIETELGNADEELTEIINSESNQPEKYQSVINLLEGVKTNLKSLEMYLESE